MADERATAASTCQPRDRWMLNSDKLSYNEEDLVLEDNVSSLYKGTYTSSKGSTSVGVERLMIETLTEDHIEMLRLAMKSFSRINSYHGVLSMHGVCLAPGNNCIVTESPGVSLHDYLLDNDVEMSVRCGWIDVVLETLIYLHQHGVTHGRLSTDSIYLLEKPNRKGEFLVKLGGFGLHPLYSSISPKYCQYDVYAAPEALQHPYPHDKRSDMWSLGCVMIEVLTGDQMWCRRYKSSKKYVKTLLYDDMDIPYHLSGSVPPQYKWCIRQCLQKEPERRLDGEWLMNNMLRYSQAPQDEDDSLNVILTTTSARIIRQQKQDKDREDSEREKGRLQDLSREPPKPQAQSMMSSIFSFFGFSTPAPEREGLLSPVSEWDSQVLNDPLLEKKIRYRREMESLASRLEEREEQEKLYTKERELKEEKYLRDLRIQKTATQEVAVSKEDEVKTALMNAADIVQRGIKDRQKQEEMFQSQREDMEKRDMEAVRQGTELKARRQEQEYEEKLKMQTERQEAFMKRLAEDKKEVERKAEELRYREARDQERMGAMMQLQSEQAESKREKDKESLKEQRRLYLEREEQRLKEQEARNNEFGERVKRLAPTMYKLGSFDVDRRDDKPRVLYEIPDYLSPSFLISRTFKAAEIQPETYTRSRTKVFKQKPKMPDSLIYSNDVVEGKTYDSKPISF